jgi:2',3'-cyclic-nucleotide 2'-phosphodiesterase (5'-nucleotidase family)
MKNNKIFIIPIILITILCATWQNSFCQSANDTPPIHATILFLNDIHGHLEPFEINQEGKTNEVGGIARIATLITEIKTENNKKDIKTFVLIAGDILQGTPLSTVFKGEPDIKILNNIGVNALTIGNHEFDFGTDNFLLLKKNANFPFISSNIIWKNSRKLICEPFTTLPINKDISITIIGATTQELLTTTNPINVEKIDVLDSMSTVSDIFKKQKSKGPVILLSHSNFRTDAKIAENNQDLCAIIGGHDQILFNPYRKIGRVPLFQAFEKGKYLGRIDLAISPKTRQALITDWDYIPITNTITSDKTTEKILETYTSKLGEKFQEVIGESKTFLDGERGKIRYEETNLGDWIADIMREFTSAKIALINAGSIRSSINEGPITIEEIFKMMPYPNEIVIIELTGKEIMEALTKSIKGTREDEDGGFLHVSGISFTINNKSVENILVNKQPLNLQQTYKVAISDFLAAGGDGYTIFKDKPYTSTGLPLREIIIDTVRKQQIIDIHTDNRIKRK